MLKNLKSAAKNSIIYGIGNLSTKIIGIILIPLYTIHFSVGHFGVLGVVETFVVFITSLFSLGLYYSLARWYWDEQYKDQQKEIVTTSFFATSVVSILIVFVLSFFTEQISYALFDTDAYGYLVLVMGISAGLQLISLIPNTLLRLQEKAVFFTVGNLLKLLITLLLTVYLIVYKKRGIESVFEAQIAGHASYLLFLASYMSRNLVAKIDKNLLWDMLSFGVPIAFGSISEVVLSTSDRLILNYLVTEDEVGLYNLGFKVANTILMVIMSIQLALTPLLFKKMNDPDSKRFYSKILTYLAFLIMIVVLIFSLFSEEGVLLLARAPEYYSAYVIVPIISLALFFTVLKDTSLIGLNIVKRTKIIAILITCVSVINIALNFLLIPMFSYVGAALAKLLAHVVYFLLIFYFAQRYYRIPYELTKVFKILLVGVVLYGISLLFADFSLILKIVFKLILLGVFPIALFYLNFFEPIEIERIEGFWYKWKNPRKWRNNLKEVNLK